MLIDYITSIETKVRELNVIESGLVIEAAEGKAVAVMGYKSEVRYSAASDRINALVGS